MSSATAMRVLSNSVVTQLLVNLEKQDVLSLADAMSAAFTINTSGSDEERYQVPRQVVTRPDGQTSLFMPATTPDALSFKLVGVPPPGARPNADTGYKPLLRGLVAICDREGRCKGMLNSEETTAFRTSLGAMILYHYRRRTSRIVMFGAGKQALWHLWLAITMRGPDIDVITIVNRTLSSAEKLRDRLREIGRATGRDSIVSRICINVVQPDDAGKREFVEQADVIFCATPSDKPLFPAEWVLQSGGGDGDGHVSKKTRYISAIGSYKPNMIEIDPELVKSFSHKSKSGDDLPTSMTVVDHLEGCAVEAGEIIQSGIPHDTIHELGKIVGNDLSGGNLAGILAEGNVIYKSVGAGFMDLVIGDRLLELAAEKNVGVCVEDF